MGRMKHGKPNPHNDNRKVVVKKDGGKDEKKKKVDENEDQKENWNYVPEEYRKRKLESNHDRYDEPIDDRDDDDDDDIVDETKNFDYIKTHYSGVSSHFQFEDEKEWETNETTAGQVEDLLQLNLHKLSVELSDVNIFDRLNLKDVDESVKYCIEDLAEIANISKTSTGAPKTKPQAKSSAKSYTWSYEGLEDEYKENLQRKTKVASITSVTAGQVPEIAADFPSTSANKSQASTHQPPTSIPNGKKMDGQPNKGVDASKTNSAECEDEIDLDDLLDNELSSNDKEVINQSELSDKSGNASKTSVGETKETNDLDLDDLLNAEPSSAIAAPSKDNDVKDSHLKVSDAKELDDWLDSILD